MALKKEKKQELEEKRISLSLEKEQYEKSRNIDLIPILKKIKPGTILYSPIIGRCKVTDINNDNILITSINNTRVFIVLFKTGHLKEIAIKCGGEPLLRPNENPEVTWEQLLVKNKRDLNLLTPVMFKQHFINEVTNFGYYAGQNAVYIRMPNTNEHSLTKHVCDIIVPTCKFNFKNMSFNAEDNYGKADLGIGECIM